MLFNNAAAFKSAQTSSRAEQQIKKSCKTNKKGREDIFSQKVSARRGVTLASITEYRGTQLT
jgi:hypothetical protein